jgi:hypothetical protein
MPLAQNPPPRVKVYGFLSLTKRQYLMTLVGALGLLVILTPLWFLQGHEYVRQFFQARAPALAPLVQYVPFVVLAAVVLEGIEVWLVLRKFARLEAEQRRKEVLNTPR